MRYHSWRLLPSSIVPGRPPTLNTHVSPCKARCPAHKRRSYTFAALDGPQIAFPSNPGLLAVPRKVGDTVYRPVPELLHVFAGWIFRICCHIRKELAQTLYYKWGNVILVEKDRCITSFSVKSPSRPTRFPPSQLADCLIVICNKIFIAMNEKFYRCDTLGILHKGNLNENLRQKRNIKVQQKSYKKLEIETGLKCQLPLRVVNGVK